jgi:hypothetical protein
LLSFQGILVVHLVATAYMTGIVWFCQATHYALMPRIPMANLQGYAAAHTVGASWVIAPVMLVELLTGGWLLYSRLQSGWTWTLEPILLALNGLLLLDIWAVTGGISVPAHQQLRSTDWATTTNAEALSSQCIQRLLWSNQIRVALWTMRILVLTWLLFGEVVV